MECPQLKIRQLNKFHLSSRSSHHRNRQPNRKVDCMVFLFSCTLSKGVEDEVWIDRFYGCHFSEFHPKLFLKNYGAVKFFLPHIHFENLQSEMVKYSHHNLCTLLFEFDCSQSKSNLIARSDRTVRLIYMPSI